MSHLNIGFKFGAGDPEHLEQTSREHKEEAARVKCVISSNSCRLISAYNSLTDKHLAGYFSNARIRRHLQRAGLITRSGRIVPDKEYRHKLIQRAHQRHVRECLAQAIFHKVLEMERLHQIEIKRKLEEFARRERVRKIKVERSKRHEEGFVHILSPRPPTGARGIWKQHSGPEGEHSESSESPNSSRPNTAPGKMQRPVRLKPIHSNSTTASVRRSSPYRLLDSSHENDVLFNCTMEKEPRRRLTPVEAPHGISPYCLPVINNFVTPVPPATKRKERGLKVTRSSTVRGRRLHPTTASSGADDTPVLRSSVHQSRVSVNMVYFGKTVRLSNDLTDTRDEVKVFQQHCGGENLCVYKGKLHEGETFQFISRRHRGFPFSLTFFLNGLQVERLSSCCEFKHRKGSRLGGKHGHFGFSSVEGAAPCYKCIVAMGLDKKPTPPPKRVKEDVKGEESVSSPKNAPEMEMERTEEDAGSHSACETSQQPDTETPVEEETAPEGDKDRDDYEEDFEADDERPAQGVKEEKSPSPPSEKERQIKEKDASETDNDEKDEDTRSHSGSSSSGSERDESDAEDAEDINEDKKAEQPREDRRAETVAQPVENDEPNPEEAAATEDSASVARDSHVDSAGDSTEIEISDTSVPSASDTRQSDDKDAEKMIEESKDEEEQERAKSVQEKLAEAVLKEAQCSSEPELSDTSTEEEEESTHKSPQQDNQDAAPDRPVAFTEQQTKHEESDTGEVVVPQKQEDSPATKEQSDDELEPHENRDSAEDEKAGEDEKAAEDEATADEDKSEERGETLHLLKEEKLAEDDKTTEPLVETPAETTDAGTAEKDEDKEEKTAVEADVQCDETVQGAKSGEEDESSVSEPDEKTDAVPDNAEAETMTARETKEIKAESSEEREALSYEEAPVTDAEKREPADSEDGAAASESEVTVENSSSSPNGSGETTVEKVEDRSEGNTKDESSKDEIKEQISGKETIEDDSREPGEEGMETEEDKQKSEEDGEGEKEKQTHATSDEIKEDENTEKRENDEEEGTDIQEETVESADNATETKEKGEETVTSLGEEEKASQGEKFEESEKAENDETCECVENKQEESEAKEADEIEGEDKNETERAIQERSPEAEKSENENENKSEKSEDKESKHEEEDDEENPVGEGTSEAAEVTEKSDVGVNETPDVTKSTEETPEFESVEQEPGRASDTSEVDAENGEISTGAESKNHEDEGAAQPNNENDLKTKGDGEEESKSDRPAEDERTDIKELTIESEESAEKHEDDEAGRAPEDDEAEHDAVQGGDNVEKNDDSTPGESQPETAATEIKEELQLDDRVDNEETEEDQNGNKSDNGNENKEPDFIRKESSFEGNTDDREQSPAPVAVDLRDTASKLDEENKESDLHPHTSENAVGVDPSAADGENGADASKASEEGASVLLKPQAQNSEADNTEQSVAAGQGNPETLGREDNTDLVTSWVNKHQSSKFFETFVEPLEDLREARADTPASNSNKEETKSTELPGSESPLKMMRMSEDEERARTDTENVPQAGETDMKAESEQSEESAASREMISEEHKGSKGDMGPPQESSDQKSAKEGINEETSLSKTEEESISGSHHSATGNPESVSKNRPDEETANKDLTVKQPRTEEGHQSTSPPGAEDISETREKADEQTREVTGTSDFTTSKCDDGSREERRNEGMEGRASDRSTGGDGKELQLIEGIKHTLGKDQLSSFSVDETLLVSSSYPLLTAARAESGS